MVQMSARSAAEVSSGAYATPPPGLMPAPQHPAPLLPLPLLPASRQLEAQPERILPTTSACVYPLAQLAQSATSALSTPTSVKKSVEESVVVSVHDSPSVQEALEQAEWQRRWHRHSEARSRYDLTAAAYSPITAENLEEKMTDFCTRCETVYGPMPFATQHWGTSLLGTLVGLVCAQTCRNSWSSIGYTNLVANFPGETPGEPNWYAFPP